jgi:hypothetical protein
MKKSLYLKLSQQEANKKLQQIFVKRYKNIEQKNHILGWLYLPFAYIGFSIVAIVSYISRLTLFFKDIRFTPHYMRTTVRYNNMSLEQANEYLNSQMQEYKNSLSYGNFSPQERNSIDTTFELLYDEYKLPDPEDKKHLAVISGLSEIKDITNDSRTIIDEVAIYTNRKQDEEIQEKEHQERLRREQEKRQTTAHNREKGKMLTSFESALTDRQIDILVDYCNQIPVFERDIEFREMKDILLCVHKKPLKLTVNKYLSLLFTELYNKKLICKNWKSVAFRHKCFLSVNDNVLDSNDYYMANQASGLIDPEKYNLIIECIDKIVKLDCK